MTTSTRQLSVLRKALRDEIGIDVEWVITQAPDVASLEAGLIDALRLRLGLAVKSAQISSPNRPPIWVWLDSDTDRSKRPQAAALEDVAAELFRVYGYPAPRIAFLDGPALPSPTALLRIVKVRAPTTVQALGDVLRASGIEHPGTHWLQNELDKLRRKGFVVRSSSGMYALTGKGLAFVPHGRSRASSDVQRALAISRRRW